MSKGALSGKTAIVTGASSGIGREIALRFARAGARVAALDLAEEVTGGGCSVVKEISSAGGTAEFHQVDVSFWADIDRSFSRTIELWRRIDIVVNCAAYFKSASLLDTSIGLWDRMIAVNLTGMFHGCKRAVEQMRGQEPINEVRGRIINIASQHGVIAAPDDFAYGVSKAGGIYMTRQIAVDYARDLIVCNSISPGKILTHSASANMEESYLAYSKSRTPWPRLGRPADVANAAAFLASDEASYITGANLFVDGGWMAA